MTRQQKQVFEINTGETKFWITLFIIAVVAAGYFMLNCRALTDKMNANEQACKLNRDTYDSIKLNYQSQIDTLTTRLNVVTGERDTCRNSEVLRRGGIPVDTQTTKSCSFKGVSGTGKFYDDCNGNKVIYSCMGKEVSCEEYRDCECPGVNPDCNQYIC